MQMSGASKGSLRDRARRRIAERKERSAERLHRLALQRQARDRQGKTGEAERASGMRDFGDPWGGAPL